MPRWSITLLEDSPTLARGPAGDLKYDDGHTRLWLAHPGGQVLVERRDPATGSWEPVRPAD